jgi:hypothetical protein
MKRPLRWAALAAIVALGFALRLNLSVKAFFSTSDTSTVGLMGIHILEGERPLFYYGQNYMGALEAYVAAVMFALFGVSTTSLSLSPILFALGWIAATYLLFSELFDPRAGLAAALCTAAAGWYPLWFSMASNGGYPGTFFFGTLFLYFAVRFAGGELSPRLQWAHAGAMGMTAALGVWTNFQVGSYLVTGAIVLLVGAGLRKGSPSYLFKIATAAMLGLLGFVPLLAATWGVGLEAKGVGGVSLTNITGSFAYLLRRLPRLYQWPLETPKVYLYSAYAAYGGAVLLYFAKVLSGPRWQSRVRWLVPALFAAVFLLFYLSHPLARTNAPRYLIPLVSLLTAAFFGAAVSVRTRWMRITGWALLALWTSFNLLSALKTADSRAARKKAHVRERTEIIARAEDAGLRHLMILGSSQDGLNGQSLTFTSGDRVRFVASKGERYQPAAEAAELDPATGFMTRMQHRKKLRRSLAAAGISSYREEHTRKQIIIHEIKVPHFRRRSIPSARMKVESDISGEEDAWRENLLDRSAGTEVGIARGVEQKATLTISLDRPARIDGLWLTDEHSGSLPLSFSISTSLDGISYAPVSEGYEDILPTYIAGNRVYIMGYFTRHDLRFSPVEVRFIRLTIGGRRDSRRGWKLDEIFVFERIGAGTPVPDSEVESIAGSIIKGGTTFTAADRWLSARLGVLLPAGEGGPAVYPRFNTRHRHTIVSRRFSPRRGLSVVVESGVADECEAVLARALPAGARLEREDFPHYSLFSFSGEEAVFAGQSPSLEWNGHMVLETDDSVVEPAAGAGQGRGL